jgi:nucleolar GTP-binding protein
VVINKIDVTRLEDISPENRALVEDIIAKEDVKLVQMSCHSEEGVMDLKNQACDALLAHRVEHKINTSKVNNVLNRIHVALPKARDEIVRAPFIPEAVLSRKPYDKNDPGRIRLERDLEAEGGGPGVFNIDMKSMIIRISFLPGRLLTHNTENYLLRNPEWNHDVIPEIWEGKNVADFVDVDIMEKLEALEREEEKLEAEGFYESDPDEVDPEDEIEAAEFAVATKHKQISQANKKNMRNQARMPRTAGLKTLSEMSQKMTAAGLDPSRIEERARTLAKARAVKYGGAMELDGDDADEAMDIDGAQGDSQDVNTSKRGMKPRTDRRLAGLRNAEVRRFFLLPGHLLKYPTFISSKYPRP